jgi:phosphatidylethanolamine/phosphatidyl-N-methylethanolamine N-methyltransferase
MQPAMTHAAVTKTYDRWAPVYDKVFGSVFEQARRTAIEACEQVGGRVLEVGVGTGISLPYYSQRCRITGIDISEEMLEVARQRVADLHLSNVEQIAVMDAQRLDFATGAFDVVTAQYVVNTVPDPEAALDEFVRVLRPGGELVVINRIGAEAGPRLAVEKILQPMVQRLGWRTEFPWSRFTAWAAASGCVDLLERRPVKPFGHFALIRFRKRPADAASPAPVAYQA